MSRLKELPRIPTGQNKKVTIFINSSGHNYQILKLFQTKPNPSIYLHLSQHNKLKRSGVGKINFQGIPLMARIEYNNSDVFFKPINHSSVHEDGSAHVKFTDETYVQKTTGLPLKNLKGARHLWTIIPGRFKEENSITTLPKDYRILTIPDEVRAVGIVFFAVPKGNLHFNFSFLAEDLDTSTGRFPFGFDAWECNYYTIYFFAYSTLKFVSPPPTTYAFSDIYNLIPFVKEMNESYMDIELREFTSVYSVKSSPAPAAGGDT